MLKFAKGYGEGAAVTLHFWRFTSAPEAGEFEAEIKTAFPEGEVIRRFRCAEGANPFWRLSVRFAKDPVPWEKAELGEFVESEPGAI